MKHLHIDIETYCDLPLTGKTAVGGYKYAYHESFQIILFAYSWDGVNFECVDCSADTFPGESIPQDVWQALTDPDVLKIAHNANFEITCINRYFLPLDTSQWYCTQVGAAYLGLPLALDNISKVLKLTEQKDARGKALIKYFCTPCNPTKANGGRTRNLPEHAPEKWEEFKEYNIQDVRVECDILNYIRKFPKPPPQERLYWLQDQRIAMRGITIDREYIEAAIAANVEAIADIRNEIIERTGVDNPNSPAQLRAWLSEETGETVKSIGKEYLAEMLESPYIPDTVRRVLKLRAMGSKSSVTKYDTMLRYATEDDRIRGLIQFYGANRTGRFAGRGVQIQNLTKTMAKNLLMYKEAVRKGFANLLFDNVPKILSQLIRSALIAAPGKKLAVSDFASIEARILAWLAGETWVLDVFNTHGLIYEATAANMFKIPIESVTKGSDYRAKGKIAALALGYQGAVGALVKMGALREGLTEPELLPIVQAWRAANPNIVKFWRKCESAAKHVVSNRTRYVLKMPACELVFSYERGYLFIELPSGRRLAYYGATVKQGKLMYWGMDQIKKIWVPINTYGGSLVENITQAVARDCLTEAMLRMDDKVNILMHIHDEIVAESDEDQAAKDLEVMEQIMSVSPLWAKGLPLKGDGYISQYYKKD